MAETKEVLVLGGGPAAGLAACTLGEAGKKVLWVDPLPGPDGVPGAGMSWRTTPLGERDPSAGRLLIERRFSFLTSTSGLSINFRDTSLASRKSPPAVVERSRMHQRLVARAKRARVNVWTGPIPRVLADRNGRITGIEGEGIAATGGVTILEDPRALDLAAKAGVRVGADPARKGVEEILVETEFGLSASKLSDRFGAGSHRGGAWEAVLGFLPKGAMGYGYLLPGEEALYAGVLLHADSLARAGLTLEEAARRFEAHPSVAPYLREATRRATSTRRFRPGAARRGTLFGDGFMVTGDATGWSWLDGLIARKWDLALSTGTLAAATALEALTTGDSSPNILQRYAQRIEREGLNDELARAGGGSPRFKWNPRVHELYPRLFSAAFRRMMTENGQPKEHLQELLRAVAREEHVPYTSALLDAVRAIANL